MTDRHLDTSAGVLRFCELRRREMADHFRHHGRFEVNGYSFTGYVFATHDIRAPRNPDEWKTRPKLDHVEAFTLRMPEVIGQVIPNSQITLLWSRVIREYSKITRAIGTLIMTEMWYVHQVSDGRPLKEQRDDLPENLADADNRLEVLMMMLEHSATGARTWTSEIKRDPIRLEPWTEQRIKPISGRLVNLSNYQS